MFGQHYQLEISQVNSVWSALPIREISPIRDRLIVFGQHYQLEISKVNSVWSALPIRDITG